MRRFFIFLLTMSAIVGVSFADGVRYVYWFDSEPTQQELTNGTLDCSHLMTGLHYVHFQAFDTDGVPVPTRSKAFMVMNDYVGTLARMTYWIDKETEQHDLTGTAVDCSDLGLGIHNIHFQGYDTYGTPLPPRTRSFLVLPNSIVSSTSYVSTTYWFDKETVRHDFVGNAIDCTGLNTGVHTVHFQAIDNTDRLTSTMTKTFLVFIDNMMPSSDYTKIEYWLDKETARHELVANAIDCSTLPTGVHAMHVQLFDADGKAAPTYSQMFLNLDLSAHQLYYWFDTAAERHLMDVADTEISVEGLANGHHTIHAMLADAHGNVMSTEQVTADFTIVCPDGEHTDANADGVCDVCDENFLYTRSTTDGRYGTVCLPKGASAGDISGATLYSIAGKRLNANDEPISIVLEEVEDIEAGVPYIFLGTGSDLVVTYSGQAVAEAGSENGLVGSFAGQDVAEGLYLLSNNQIVKCGTGCSIGANRAYIDMAEVPAYVEGSVAPSRMRVIGFEGVTGIDGITIEGDAVRYNLSGIRIPRGTKGITIINGKTIINK